MSTHEARGTRNAVRLEDLFVKVRGRKARNEQELDDFAATYERWRAEGKKLPAMLDEAVAHAKKSASRKRRDARAPLTAEEKRAITAMAARINAKRR